MSNYFHLHCIDCDECMGDSINGCNHGEAGLVVFLANRRVFVAAAEATWHAAGGTGWIDMEITVNGSPMLLHWLGEHVEHDLVVMSEYHDHYLREDGLKTDFKREGT